MNKMMSTPIVPLEIHGMVRACHPITPYVGLYRHSGDPEITKQCYKRARRKRDIVCFPFMLKQMTQFSIGYRSIRRLWITVIDKILINYIFMYKPFLVKYILGYLSYESCEKQQIPLFYCKHMEESLQYQTLNLDIRMQQIAGRFVSLGYTKINISTPDYEYEGYLILCDPSEKDKITLLYHELKKKGIQNIKPIVLSHICHPKMNEIVWLNYCLVNRLSLYLEQCIRTNQLSQEETLLLRSWVTYMNYPSKLTR